MKFHDIQQNEAKKVLSYCPNSGIFRWKNPSKFHAEKIGLIAGTTAFSRGKEYVSIGLMGCVVKAHRLAWLFVYGYWPTMIDHINGNSLDNRISNLVECTPTMNCQNHTKSINGSGLPVGVRNTKNGKFQARIKKDKINIHLGTFNTADEASFAYTQKRIGIHYCPAFAEGGSNGMA